MNIYLVYGIILVILLAVELLYFKIADKFNIIDKPNERSSHSTIVLRGGGIIFTLAMMVWAIASIISDKGLMIGDCYPFFLMGLILVASVSFIDDIRSLPDSVRLVIQFVSMGLLLWNVFGPLASQFPIWALVSMAVVGLVVCVGATNIINFMDGINGITAGYALSVLVPLFLMNDRTKAITTGDFFILPSFLACAILGVVVFCLFNFRHKGKAKCFEKYVELYEELVRK